jgi:hypothetical protein
MQWFKHHNNFRNSPAMQHVEQVLGASGVASVYRLYEVFTERFGVDNGFTDPFSGSLLLAPPTSEQWLVSQILFSHQEEQGTEDEYTAYPTIKDLRYFLRTCETARIITIKRERKGSTQIESDGTSKNAGEQEWWTITIPEFAKLSDVYAHRQSVAKNKALETTR